VTKLNRYRVTWHSTDCLENDIPRHMCMWLDCLLSLVGCLLERAVTSALVSNGCLKTNPLSINKLPTQKCLLWIIFSNNLLQSHFSSRLIRWWSGNVYMFVLPSHITYLYVTKANIFPNKLFCYIYYRDDNKWIDLLARSLHQKWVQYGTVVSFDEKRYHSR